MTDSGLVAVLKDFFEKIKAVARPLPGYAAVARFWRSVRDPRFRESLRLSRAAVPQVFQAGGRTAPDRYPFLFAALRDQLETVAAPRILSFGCSTGEELLSLRRYIPSACLTGIDINQATIRLARRHIADPAIQLICAPSLSAAGSGSGARVGSFDAIVCLSVLQHSVLNHQRPPEASPWLPFSRFEQAVEDLDRHLAPGGVLLLYHTNFRFIDTAVASRYQPLLVVDPLSRGDTIRYGRDNRQVREAVHQRFALYRKTA